MQAISKLRLQKTLRVSGLMLNVVQPFEAGEASDDDKDGNGADMKMHMRVKARTKTMDESARTDVNIAFIDTGCAGTVLMEVGVDHAQKNPQRGIECLGIVL